MIDKNLQKNIEAILFWKGEPIKIKDLLKILNISNEVFLENINDLKNNLKENTGLQIILTDDSIALVTNAENSEIITKLQKEELDKELSKSALETLAIIIYRGPIKKSDLDFIRGVNSQFILRNLQIRGLIEKIINPKDERGYLYKPSMELLGFLGLSNIQEIENYDKVNNDIKTYLESHQNAE